MCDPVLVCKCFAFLARRLRDRCRRSCVPDMPILKCCICYALGLHTSEPVCVPQTPKSCPNAADTTQNAHHLSPCSSRLTWPGRVHGPPIPREQTAEWTVSYCWLLAPQTTRWPFHRPARPSASQSSLQFAGDHRFRFLCSSPSCMQRRLLYAVVICSWAWAQLQIHLMQVRNSLIAFVPKLSSLSNIA